MVEFILNGQNITAPMGWESAMVNAIFMQRSQPDITVDQFTFEKDAIVVIDKWIQKNGYFRGCPFVIKKGTTLFFDGYLDLKTKLVKVHKGKYVVGIEKSKGLNSLANRIEGYTLGLLASRLEAKGESYSSVDIPYVVVQKYTTIEFAMLSLTTYLLIKELNESIKTLQEDINNLSKAATPNPPSPVNLSGILNAVLQLIVNLAYAVAMVLALKDLIIELIDSLYSIVRKHKGFLIKDVLDSFVKEIGFKGIEFGFSDMDSLYYFPSKEEENKSNGVPSASDYGYLISEQFQFIKDAFKADISIDNKGVIQVRNENDNYFVRNSTFVMPDILQESEENNANEIKGTRIVSFKTDIADEWTIDNYKGTSFETHTRSISEEGESLIDGFQEIRLNVALGNRKDKFTPIEKQLKEVAQLADKVINSLGGDSNLAGRVKKKLNYIKVSNNSWSEPKIMKLNNNLQLNANHREEWSAKYLVNNFHSVDSFVLNDFYGQRYIKKGVKIPMCDSDFLKLQNNSYFTTKDGEIGKFTKLQYALEGGNAIGDYWIKKIYDRNLKEENVEP